MSEPTITIHNAQTGEVISRPMNEEELAQYEIDQVEAAAKKLADAEKLAARNALLDKLGITNEEAKLLLS